MSLVVVFGGYGVFGAHVARESARLGLELVIAGRDGARAEAFARGLGPAHRGIAADVTQRESCQAVLRGVKVAINCAGPFAAFHDTLLESCLQAGCHYADIADDRGHTRLIRGYHERFSGQGLAAVYGCSSLPGISGALAIAARQAIATAPERARVTLFVGSDNPKGAAAMQSVVGSLGQPIAAPQGTLRGFRAREVVPLPEPFGPRAVFTMNSPDYDLLPDLLGVASVTVKVGSELRLVNYLLALLSVLPWHSGRRTARVLAFLGNSFRLGGCSGGAVMAELFFADGSVRRTSLVARTDGQRMAALPCAFVARDLCAGTNPLRGAQTAYEFLGAERLLQELQAAGFDWRSTSA
jgi:hypothetical protein